MQVNGSFIKKRSLMLTRDNIETTSSSSSTKLQRDRERERERSTEKNTVRLVDITCLEERHVRSEETH